MAGSNITKKALAMALKELTNEIPFSKITVEDICEHCGMNRTSFYYHFKDKYDLINWIFDMEFVKTAQSTLPETALEDARSWDIYVQLSNYLYANRNFYNSVFQFKGQNSLSDHFRDICQPFLTNSLKSIMKDRPIEQFHLDFFTDATLCAIERWISNKDCIPPDQFIELLRSCIDACRNIATNSQ